MLTEVLATTAAALSMLMLIVWRAWCWRRRGRRDDAHWLPGDLQASRLVYVEKLFRANGALKVRARIDRAYRDSAGIVTLVELKTRDVDRVYLSDIVELSAQRYALAAETGEVVSMHGYVLVESKAMRCRTAHRVNLLSEYQVAALVARREALLAGAIHARRACSKGVCRKCMFVENCHKQR